MDCNRSSLSRGLLLGERISDPLCAALSVRDKEIQSCGTWTKLRCIFIHPVIRFTLFLSQMPSLHFSRDNASSSGVLLVVGCEAYRSPVCGAIVSPAFTLCFIPSPCFYNYFACNCFSKLWKATGIQELSTSTTENTILLHSRSVSVA